MAFCKHGHDTSIVGRNKYNVCRECSRNRVRKWAEENLEKGAN